MADKKPGGLLAIIGAGGKKPEDEADGEPKSPKARAVKDFFDACNDGDWDEAAQAFGRAYDICKMKGEEGGDDESEDYEGSDEEE